MHFKGGGYFKGAGFSLRMCGGESSSKPSETPGERLRSGICGQEDGENQRGICSVGQAPFPCQLTAWHHDEAVELQDMKVGVIFGRVGALHWRLGGGCTSLAGEVSGNGKTR